MEMDMEPITSGEALLIKQFRLTVSDLQLKGYYDTDIFYLKWLRARELQMDRAEEMLRKHILWRKQNDIDSILSWEPESPSLPVDFPVEICGYNKVGCPLVIIPFCHWDVRSGVEAGLGPQLVRYVDQVLELFEEVIRQQSRPERPVTQLDLIFDMNSLSFWQLASMKTIELMLDVVRRYEANHPEILHRAYVINASRIFNMLYNIVKPFLSPRTLSKVRIFSTQPTQWMPVLHRNIEKEQLPTYFGGLNRTSLPMYQETQKSIKYKLGVEDGDGKLTTININPQEKVLVTFEVDRVDSILKWEFRTDYYDIQFSVYRDLDGGDRTQYVPAKRFPSQFVKVEGQISCDKPGKYVAEFNNKYSAIRRAKTLRYNFQVLPPPRR